MAIIKPSRKRIRIGSRMIPINLGLSNLIFVEFPDDEKMTNAYVEFSVLIQRCSIAFVIGFAISSLRTSSRMIVVAAELCEAVGDAFLLGCDVGQLWVQGP